MERRRRASPRRLAAASLLLLAAVALPPGERAASAAAAPRVLRLAYLGYLDEARVARLEIDLDLSGAGPERVGERYRLSLAGGLIGPLGKLFPFHLTAGAHGSAGHGGVRPERFDAATELWDDRRAVALTYRPNGSVALVSDPPTVEGSRAIAGGLADRTLDPMSGALALLDRAAREGGCGGRVRVFDGIRRYDLEASTVGRSSVNRRGEAIYSGPAEECRLGLKPLQGFPEQAIRQGLYPTAARLWLAPVVSGLPALPVRMMGSSTLGQLRLDLVEAYRLPNG
ncbi:MAG: DUF3108 domain-containing protein [Dongiaceae bacterium]